MVGSTILLVGLTLATAPDPHTSLSPYGLDRARIAWQAGKYASAQEQYEKALSSAAIRDLAAHPRISSGLADTLLSQGEIDRALAVLRGAALLRPSDPNLQAKIADILLQKGDWEGADAANARALAAAPNHLLARWNLVRLHEVRGQKDDAIQACRWFVEHHNANAGAHDSDSNALILIGQAAEKYFRAQARGEDLSQSLNDVINQIYERALQVDPNCWQAAWLEGRLFLSGYSEGKATPELQRALKINPVAVEAIVTSGQADLQGYALASGRKKAEQALEINPKCLAAYVLLADLNISDERFGDALDAAKKAIEINPRDEGALARLSASQRLTLDRGGALATELQMQAWNPRPATFYAAFGERMADRRKYPEAERAFLKAIAADPEQADAQIGLGMLYMQVGREVEAKALFDSAFAADPFNVRADNMMKVLDHMAGYSKIESPHYSVAVEPQQDALIGRYMSKYLESVHGELTKKFAYEPPGRTQIEILKSHQWFSGRTIGQPFIPTVGACTGKVVALASPRATNKPFNWARVLKHEVVHVITLQQTEFNIPHWYTEALAVDSEGYPRPQEWNKMLLERVPQRKLLNLETINLGFIRPKEPEERQLAYCQAQLYAQYMVKRFGPDSLARMLDAYRRGLTTPQAVVASFKVPVDDFENGYLEFVDEAVKTIKARTSSEQPVSFSKLEADVKAKPEDADLNARMAYEYFARRELKGARPFADKALKLKPHHPLASYVKARLMVTIGDEDAALEILRPALDASAPNERVVDLLAELEMKAGRLDEAERLYEMAHKGDPTLTKWIAGLGRVHLRQQREDKFLEDLALLANNDADDLALRKELASRHLKRGESEAAERWARECLYIEVYDAACHLLLADAAFANEKYADAAEEYEVILSMRPERPQDIRVKLAKSQAALGRKDEARKILRSVLDANPGHAEAKAALADLDQ